MTTPQEQLDILIDRAIESRETVIKNNLGQAVQWGMLTNSSLVELQNAVKYVKDLLQLKKDLFDTPH